MTAEAVAAEGRVLEAFRLGLPASDSQRLQARLLRDAATQAMVTSFAGQRPRQRHLRWALVVRQSNARQAPKAPDRARAAGMECLG